MSSIEKLSIRGIRSFSPNREEVVEFYHPLTVILGDNGRNMMVAAILHQNGFDVRGILQPTVPVVSDRLRV